MNHPCGGFYHGILVVMLTAQIRADMTTAMKARDALRVETLRGAMTAFTNELVAKGKKPTDELTDAEAITVLRRLSKQRKDSVEQYEKGGRAELAEKESKELKIIQEYLPQTIGKDAIEKVAREKMQEMGIADASGAGKLTGAVMKALVGQADGGDVKAVVALLLG